MLFLGLVVGGFGEQGMVNVIAALIAIAVGLGLTFSGYNLYLKAIQLIPSGIGFSLGALSAIALLLWIGAPVDGSGIALYVASVLILGGIVGAFFGWLAVLAHYIVLAITGFFALFVPVAFLVPVVAGAVHLDDPSVFLDPASWTTAVYAGILLAIPAGIAGAMFMLVTHRLTIKLVSAIVGPIMIFLGLGGAKDASDGLFLPIMTFWGFLVQDRHHEGAFSTWFDDVTGGGVWAGLKGLLAWVWSATVGLLRGDIPHLGGRSFAETAASGAAGRETSAPEIQDWEHEGMDEAAVKEILTERERPWGNPSAEDLLASLSQRLHELPDGAEGRDIERRTLEAIELLVCAYDEEIPLSSVRRSRRLRWTAKRDNSDVSRMAIHVLSHADGALPDEVARDDRNAALSARCHGR